MPECTVHLVSAVSYALAIGYGAAKDMIGLHEYLY